MTDHDELKGRQLFQSFRFDIIVLGFGCDGKFRESVVNNVWSNQALYKSLTSFKQVV